MAASMLENTDIIASEPHVLQALVDPFAEGREDASTPQGTLALLQHQLQNESENGWQLACLPRPWKVGDEAQMKALDVATKHVLPTINVPDTIYAGQTLLFPQVHFSVYSNQEVETVPSTANIASTLVRDAIVDTINLLDFNRNATSRFLIDVDCYFAPGTFVKRATPFDRLRDIEAGKSTWKPEDVAVDAVFSQLFQLPAPEQKLVYYHSVLIESCKIAPAAIAPSLGRAIRFLYRNVETMDLELSYRFMDWFAHHLSNFGFTWKWTEWVDDVHLADYDPRKSFIKGALDKEIRLSFAQRIKGTLPPPYQTLISAEKEKDSPDFKFQDPSKPTVCLGERVLIHTATPFASTALEIHGALRRKAPASEMEPLLATIQSAAQTEHSHSAPHLPAIDAFVTSLCHIGSKSLSHMLSCIERNKDQLLAFAGSGNDAVKQIIDSVSAYWQHHPGTSVNIIGKLLNYLIVTPQSVIEWCIGDNSTSLAQMWCYELVAETVGKVSTRTRQVINASTDGEDETMHAQHNTAIELAKTARKDLAALLEDILSSWASGSKDQAMQSGDGSSEAEAATRVWARRWLRSFRREAAVQEVWGERSAERVAIQRVQTAVSTELAEKDRARTEKKRLQQEEQAERKRQEQQEQQNAGGIDEAIDHSADLVDTDVVNFDEAV